MVRLAMTVMLALRRSSSSPCAQERLELGDGCFESLTACCGHLIYFHGQIPKAVKSAEIPGP